MSNGRAGGGRRRYRPGALLVPLLAVAGGCAAHRPPAANPPPGPGAALTAPYAAAATAGHPVFRLDAAASHVYVLVGKAGPLAAAGHVHVVVPGDLRGFAELGPTARADLVFAVGALAVDPPAARSAVGGEYAAPIDASARAGTRRHMLGPAVLDAKRYPRIRVAVRRSGPAPGPVRVAISLHGETRELSVPAQVATTDGGLSATGSFTIRQSEFGIRPYSILLGALRVRDALQIRYHLVFRPWCPAPSC